MPGKPRPIEFVVDEKTGCFIVTSHADMRIGHKQRTGVHQFIYQELFGFIPEGMYILRTCGNERCICPEHMEPVTYKEMRSRVQRIPIDFVIDPDTNCFNCISHKPNQSGYPALRTDKKSMPVYRFIYKQMFGEVPKGKVIRHRCDNRLCINPEHLLIGTPADNVQDKVERDRQAKGSSIYKAKLDEEQVREIKRRLAKGEGVRQIAREFNISHCRISEIKTGKAWKHVTID